MRRHLSLPPWLRGWLARRLARPFPATAASRRRRACLYKVDRLGDFVLATGSLRTLVNHLGANELRLVVSEEAAALAAAEFPEVPRWVAPANTTGVWRELRPLRRQLAPLWASEHFDSLISLRHARSLHRDTTLAWLNADTWHGLGPGPRAAGPTLANRPELPPGYPATAVSPWCRELSAHAQVLTRVLGREATWADVQPRLHHVLPQPGQEIVVCPFGGERIRDYPTPAWMEAWRSTLPPPAAVRVLGPAARRQDLEFFAAELRRAGATVAVEVDAAPLDFVRHIAGARLVLTAESAAAHLATAFDKPAVILTGGGHFGWFAPWGENRRQRWVHHPLDCYGCNWDCRRTRIECLEDIPAPAVARAIAEVLPHG
jgi:ADP-heptose:LPS heptosyltransferase